MIKRLVAAATAAASSGRAEDPTAIILDTQSIRADAKIPGGQPTSITIVAGPFAAFVSLASFILACIHIGEVAGDRHKGIRCPIGVTGRLDWQGI